MVGGLGPGRYALTILAPLAAMLLSLPVFAWEEIGLPSIPEDSAEVPVALCHKAYIIGHSTMHRTPDWVIEHLTRAIAKGSNSRPGNSLASSHSRTVFQVPATTTTRAVASTEATKRPRTTSRARSS
jgi:hypothetical protein